MKSIARAGSVGLVFVSALLGCGQSSLSEGTPGSGGANSSGTGGDGGKAATGGAVGSGGMRSTGGSGPAVGTGGALGTGGSIGRGGGIGVGGAFGRGGASGSGGRIGTGGATATGGTSGIPTLGNICSTPLPKPLCNGNPPYVNPASGDVGIHDPSVVAEGCTFYGFSTGSVLPNRRSTDLVNWTSDSVPSFQLPAWTGAGIQIWAPDVHYANGRFWNYYSIWHGSIPTAQIGLLTNLTLDAASPNYKWEDQGLVVDNPTGGGSNVNVIDPDLFIDDDGSWWLVYGSFNNGVRLIALNPTTGLPTNKPVAPVSLTDHLGEGSSLIKNNGFYYLFVSRGGCCAGVNSTYEIVYARATKVTGPYVTKSGASFATSSFQDATDALLRVGSDGNPGGEGGQSLFNVGGQWYIDYHAYVAGTNPAKLVVRPIYFDSTNWATFDCTKAAN